MSLTARLRWAVPAGALGIGLLMVLMALHARTPIAGEAGDAPPEVVEVRILLSPSDPRTPRELCRDLVGSDQACAALDRSAESRGPGGTRRLRIPLPPPRPDGP